MSSVIRQETAVFLYAVLHGALLTLIYDFMRALRRAFRHNLAVLSLEDFLFWLLAGTLTFLLIYQRTDGTVRGYVIVGIFLGFSLYHLTLSPLFVSLGARLFAFAWKILCLPFRLLASVARKLFIRMG
ncbi:MAG: spore cortex biosynthesis protein YabQ, partial [Lachnospiraceae bacterium]|nr:spore cortex biosynthesis protein YabQ [Lachnospiraceae bacterium]